jgi:hypothetical protein
MWIIPLRLKFWMLDFLIISSIGVVDGWEFDKLFFIIFIFI